jgi:hypothetical protein
MFSLGIKDLGERSPIDLTRFGDAKIDAIVLFRNGVSSVNLDLVINLS